MKRIYFLFAIIAIVVLTAQAFSEADADAEVKINMDKLKEMMKEICAKIPESIRKKMCPK
uniref:Venom peptide ECTX1-Rm13b n=1 Tax=Rhytidoponera metallica TaxID=148364 RepID=A0A8U0LTP3_RHYMT|nr:venom peptide precursor ECTX1-Rm13b [Rhytidoponera metallica]